MRTFEFRTGEQTEGRFDGEKYSEPAMLPAQTIQAAHHFHHDGTLSFYAAGDSHCIAQFGVRSFWYVKEVEQEDFPEEHGPQVFE